MKDKNYKRNEIYVKLRGYLVLFIILCCFLDFVFDMVRWPIYNELLDKHALTKQAIIINKENLFPNQRIGRDFSYSYQFVEKGKLYTNDSKKSGYHVGDKIFIEYLESYPDINRIKKSDPR